MKVCIPNVDSPDDYVKMYCHNKHIPYDSIRKQEVYRKIWEVGCRILIQETTQAKQC